MDYVLERKHNLVERSKNFSSVKKTPEAATRNEEGAIRILAENIYSLKHLGNAPIRYGGTGPELFRAFQSQRRRQPNVTIISELSLRPVSDHLATTLGNTPASEALKAAARFARLRQQLALARRPTAPTPVAYERSNHLAVIEQQRRIVFKFRECFSEVSRLSCEGRRGSSRISGPTYPCWTTICR
ncbi:unnamed protein product [Cyclocybe aegerita]|uniref:Uncharacterized protein n=1 Tax=Cyclocybe aegerita TaxID=1973307 RepID=A0A8S0XH41_CYCAE|nr:unnamed protein product [Cyclocybe aegerita]